MKHQNMKGEDHRSEGTKERDRRAGEEDSADNRRKLPDINLDSGGGGQKAGGDSTGNANGTGDTQQR